MVVKQRHFAKQEFVAPKPLPRKNWLRQDAPDSGLRLHISNPEGLALLMLMLAQHHRLELIFPVSTALVFLAQEGICLGIIMFLYSHLLYLTQGV
jgi:hypothetical protein